MNYALVRILPPDGTAIDPAKPPFVVVDPAGEPAPRTNNSTHHGSEALCREFLVPAIGFNKVQGRPFKVSEIAERARKASLAARG